MKLSWLALIMWSFFNSLLIALQSRFSIVLQRVNVRLTWLYVLRLSSYPLKIFAQYYFSSSALWCSKICLKQTTLAVGAPEPKPSSLLVIGFCGFEAIPPIINRWFRPINLIYFFLLLPPVLPYWIIISCHSLKIVSKWVESAIWKLAQLLLETFQALKDNLFGVSSFRKASRT